MGAVANYTVRIYPFLPTTFGVGDLAAEIHNAKNIGYSEYVNDVGEAFFTINQGDAKSVWLRDLIRDGGHLQIIRNGELAFGGWLGETDESETDAIIYGYSYASGLYPLHTDWGTEWTGQKVQKIVTDSIDRALTGLSNSRMAWMSKGTIESPVTTSGGGTELVLPYYRADYKRLLFLMQEMAAFSVSDTTNRVMFEVTPAGVFNFWKNRGVEVDGLRFQWGTRDLIGYSRLRMPADRRNTLYAVGSSPRDSVLRKTAEDTADRAARGRLEEAIYLSWVRDADELERVAKLRLQRAKRDDSDLALVFAPGRLTPMRASGSLFRLTDTVPVKIDNGVTNIDESRMIVGQQVLLYRGEEHVRLLMRDRL